MEIVLKLFQWCGLIAICPPLPRFLHGGTSRTDGTASRHELPVPSLLFEKEKSSDLPINMVISEDFVFVIIN